MSNMCPGISKFRITHIYRDLSIRWNDRYGKSNTAKYLKHVYIIRGRNLSLPAGYPTIPLNDVLFNIQLEFVLNESSLSPRWNTEDMDTYVPNNIYIAELGYTMGQAWIALKKSLRQLKYNLSIGDYDRVKPELATLGLEKQGNLVKSIHRNAQ